MNGVHVGRNRGISFDNATPRDVARTLGVLIHIWQPPKIWAVDITLERDKNRTNWDERAALLVLCWLCHNLCEAQRFVWSVVCFLFASRTFFLTIIHFGKAMATVIMWHCVWDVFEGFKFADDLTFAVIQSAWFSELGVSNVELGTDVFFFSNDGLSHPCWPRVCMSEVICCMTPSCLLSNKALLQWVRPWHCLRTLGYSLHAHCTEQEPSFRFLL